MENDIICFKKKDLEDRIRMSGLLSSIEARLTSKMLEELLSIGTSGELIFNAAREERDNGRTYRHEGEIYSEGTTELTYKTYQNYLNSIVDK